MKKNEIIILKDEFARCATSFRTEATQIMDEFANAYKFTLGYGEPTPKEVCQHKRINPGLFKEVWKYYFHGAEIRFENTQTGQILELIYITKPEFGYLDGFVFHQYVQTTDEFKELANVFNNGFEVWEAIDYLAAIGSLLRVETASVNRNIRAH